MHDPAGTGSRQISRAQAAEPRSRRGFPTRALLKSALTHIKIMAAKKEGEGGEPNKSRLDPAQTSPAPPANCHLTCREGPDPWERGGMREGREQLPNRCSARPRRCPAVPGRVQICSARNPHGGHSGFLLCSSKGKCKHSFLPEGILVQAESEGKRKGEGRTAQEPNIASEPRKRRGKDKQEHRHHKHGVPARGIG